MVSKSVLCALALLTFAPLARSADSERDRKARVALALAGAPPISLAPAPRLAVPKDYPTAAKEATKTGKPLVVFVGCKGQHSAPGAVVSRVDSLPDVEAPAALVLYPVGAELYRHTTLRCPDEMDKLPEAVRSAAKKIDTPTKDKTAPKPLEWDIRSPHKPLDLADLTANNAWAPPCDKCETCPHCGKGAKERDPRDSLVRVRKGNAQGSGTVVHSGLGWSVVLTANHVVDGGGALTVRGDGRTYPAQVVAQDKDSDLAALLVPADLPAVKVSTADLDAGADVVMVGMSSILSRGKVSSRETLGGREVLHYATHEDSDSGDSGAGVFVKGELVGVHCGKSYSAPGAKGVPHATAGKPVRAFLKRVFAGEVKAQPTAPSAPTSAPGASNADLVTASGATIRLGSDGVYRYVGEAPSAPRFLPAFRPSCAGGNCPLK